MLNASFKKHVFDMNTHSYVVYKHTFKICWIIHFAVFTKHLLTHSLTIKHVIDELSNEV